LVWTRATVRVWSEDGPLPVVRAGVHGLGHWCGRLVPLGQMVQWVVQQRSGATQGSYWVGGWCLGEWSVDLLPGARPYDPSPVNGLASPDVAGQLVFIVGALAIVTQCL
jgi:hypothetical protein